jgi:competence protein ComEC
MGLLFGLTLIALDLLYPALRSSTPSRIEGVVVERRETSRIVSTKDGRWIVDCFQSCQGDVGAIVEVDGSVRAFDPKRIDSAFDYPSYLEANGVRGRLESERMVVVGKMVHPALVRDAFFGYVDETFDPTSAAMIRYALFGDKTAIAEDTAAAVKQMGIAHLFAVSGLHLTLMVGFLKSTWNRLFWREDRFVFLLIGFLLIYNLLTGFTPSLFRASLFSFVSAFPKVRAKLANTDWLTLIGLFMLLGNPALSRHVGFQLSFLATAGLYLFEGDVQSKPNGAWKIAAMASLLTLPIILSMQGEVSLWVVFYGVAFGLAVTRALLPATIVTLLIPPLQGMYRWLAWLFLEGVRLAETLNVALPLTLCGVFWLAYWMALWPLLGKLRKNEPCLSQAALVIGIVALAQWITPIAWIPKVSVLDVNQGDAIWIEAPGCKMLIDTGDVDDYDTVVNHLRNKGIRKIDALVVTHNHADHEGELADLTTAMGVGRVYLSSPPPVPFDRASSIVKVGETIVCGSLSFDVLSANRNASNENDNSVVLMGDIGGDVWLFMADAESTVEAEVARRLETSVDILKIGHHGGQTSSTEAFLKKADPTLAIISVGTPNRFRHPHDAVLERLNAQGIRTYRTDRDGTVMVFRLGETRFVVTSAASSDRIWDLPRRIHASKVENEKP